MGRSKKGQHERPDRMVEILNEQADQNEKDLRDAAALFEEILGEE